MWGDAVALLAFVKAVGVVATLVCFFVLLFSGRISLRALRKRWWHWWPQPLSVMAGLVPTIHVFLREARCL